MPEVGDHYIGAEILLTRQHKMARGHVVACSHDASGNAMRRGDTNSILDTRMFQVEFAGSQVTELIANGIAESMYAQCNIDGSEYFLLVSLVDYHKDKKAVSLIEQQISICCRPVTQMNTAGWQVFCQLKDVST